MADRDRVLRIILEGRDKISGSLNAASKNLADFRNELKLTDDQLKKSHGSRHGPTGVFISQSDVNRFARDMGNIKRSFVTSLKDMKKEAKLFRNDFINAFKYEKEFDKELKEAEGDFEEFKRKRIQKEDELRAAELRKLKKEQLNRRLIVKETNAQYILEKNRLIELNKKLDDDAINDEISRLRILITRRNAVLRRIDLQEQERIRRKFQERKSKIELTTPGETLAELIKERRDVEKALDSLGRPGQRLGRSIGQFGRGFAIGRQNVKELTDEVRKSETIFGKFGLAIGDSTRNMGRFINLRWLFITGIITLFFNLVIRLGAALVALASSAILAAGALGGAFAASIAQLIPAVGLLAAAFSRLNVVLDLVKQSEKNDVSSSDDRKEAIDRQREAAQRLEDSQWSLKRAIEGVADAQYDLKQAQKGIADAMQEQRDAVKDLAEARKEAQRDIVDANLEERDAALGLEEAELALLDARIRLREEEEKQRGKGSDLIDAQAALKEANERLRIAKEQGDQAEISSASQNVTLAEQNVSEIKDRASEVDNDLKQAQISVQRAEINRDQAVIRKKRSGEDAAEKREKGIGGSDVVVSAQDRLKRAIEGVADAQRTLVLSNRAVRDSLHGVRIARRELTDAQRSATEATKKQTAAQRDFQEAFADLSPSEKKLFNSLKRLRKIYEDVFVGTNKKDGILGPINEAMSRFIDSLIKLLLDPKIQKALKTLAESLAGVIDKFAKFITTKEFKEDLIFFIDQAAKNLPKVAEALLNIFKIFTDIAKAASPIFDRLLDRFVGATARAEKYTGKKGTRNKEDGPPRAGVTGRPGQGFGEEAPLDKFLGTAEEHLNSWIDLGKAIVDVIAALTTTASPTGQTLLGSITKTLNNWADWMRENPEEVNEFFDKLTKNLGKLLRALGKIFLAFASEEFSAFVDLIVEVVTPGLLTLIWFLGKLSQALLALFEIPYVGQVLKWVAIGLVFERALNKIFPISQVLTNFLKKGLIGAFRGLWHVIKDPTGAIKKLAGTGGMLDTVRLKLMYLKDGLVKMKQSWKDLFKNIADGVKNAKDSISTFANTTIERLSKAKDSVIDFSKKTVTRLNDVRKAAINAAKQGFLTLAESAKNTAKAITATLMSSLRRFVAYIFSVLIPALRALKWNVRLLVGATGIGLLILAAGLIIEHWEKIRPFLTKLFNWVREKFTAIGDWLKNNWKKALVTALALIFTFPVGVIALLIFKFRDKIIGVFNKIGTAIKGAFGAAFTWVREQFTKLGNWLREKAESLPLIGRFFKNNKATVEDQNKINNAVLADKSLDPIRKKIKNLRKDGLTPDAILQRLIDTGDLDEDTYKKLAAKKGREILFAQRGLVVPGSGSKDTVPAMLTPGEWILNRSQQGRLSSALNMSAQQTKAFIFGTNMGENAPGRDTTKTKPSKKFKPILFDSNLSLIPQEDPDGVTIWFIRMADGTYGQVTSRDAKKIESSKGTYIPGYVKRSSHGFKQNIMNYFGGAGQHYNLGGVVQEFGMPGMSGPGQRFSRGGIVQKPGFTSVKRGGNKIEQNFNVRTEGETDWNYVMRIGAMHAQQVF
jgi:hypothetical protein